MTAPCSAAFFHFIKARLQLPLRLFGPSPKCRYKMAVFKHVRLTEYT